MQRNASRRIELGNRLAPKVTIGIPVFNGGAALEYAVRSALSQRGIPLQVVVSDNGSTDGSVDALNPLREDMRLLVVRHGVNRGMTWNFNWLLYSAQTPYFMWLGADDMLDPDYAALCVAALEDDPSAVLAFGAADMLLDATCEPFLRYEASRPIRGSRIVRFASVYRSLPDVYVYGVMRTIAGQSVGGLPSVPAADKAFCRRLALRGGLANVPTATYKYIVGPKWKELARIVADEGTSRSTNYRPVIRGERSLALAIDGGRAIKQSGMTVPKRLVAYALILGIEIERVVIRLVIDFLGIALPRAWKVRLAQSVHDRCVARELPRVADSDTYLSRIVLPVLRWSA